MSAVEAVLLPVGGDLYAVPMEWVREVVADPPITLLVTAPPVVLGLFNLRGQIVPLFDTAVLLGVGTVDEAKSTFVAVVQTPYGLAGLAATGLPQRAVLETATGPSELPGTIGVFRRGPAGGGAARPGRAADSRAASAAVIVTSHYRPGSA